MNASTVRARAALYRLAIPCLCILTAFTARLQAAPLFADSGFVLETVATLPINEPIGMAWGPDGAMYVWQQNGVVRVVKDGVLLPDPFIDLRGKVNIVNDRGFHGFALDPDFAANGYAYLLYTYEENGVPSDPGPKTSRLTRVTASPANRHVAVPGSETVILGKTAVAPCSDYPAGSDCIGSESHSHSVGTIRFGKDGKLLVSIGDGAKYDLPDTNALRAQDLNRYEGKILRINKDGSAPGDNPFDDGTNSIRSKVYAYGLRNPYRFGIEPVSGEPYVGDVGWNTREEVNTGKGANFGWPCFEGKDPQSRYQDRFAECRQLDKAAVTFAIHEYGGPDGHSAIGGAFLSSSAYPAKYKDNFFFADFSNTVIRRMTFGADRKVTSVTPFLTAADGPVSIELGPDGFLYYISMSAGEVRRIGLFAGDPIAKASASPISGSSPLEVAFSSEGSEDPRGLALTYLWEFGDGDSSTAPNPTHTYAPTATKTFTAKLTVTNSEDKSASDTLSIAVGSTPPKAAITVPSPGTTMSPGDTLVFKGTASDDDETLGPESMSWSVILRHNDHEHPYSTTTGSGGSFVSEAHGEGDYSYIIVLTVTDNSGLQDTQRVTVAMAPPANAPPVAIAGESRSIAFEAETILQGSASDDGLPNPPGDLTFLWTRKSGPSGGTATFASPDSLRTGVSFSKPGDYVLLLTVSDGALESTSELTLKVAEPVPVPGLNADARLSIDLDPADESPDSLITVAAGDEFWAAVRIDDASLLDAYSVEIAYDTVGLAFAKAVAGDDGKKWKNMLATLGAVPKTSSTSPTAANGRILSLEGSLSAGDSLKCPSGKGTLAWIQFKVRSPGRYRMEIRSATLADRHGNSNALPVSQFRSAAVEAQPATGIAAAAARFALADAEPFELALVDTRGRTVHRSEGRGGGLYARIAEAKARRQPRQVYALRITAPSLRAPLVLFLGPDL